MMIQGIEKRNSVIKTSAMLGSFREDAQTRKKLSLLNLPALRVVTSACLKESGQHDSQRCNITLHMKMGGPETIADESWCKILDTGNSLLRFLTLEETSIPREPSAGKFIAR